ncbi:hypothetical protein [Pseudooceanicola sp.]|uniref:hypothetical protein n=1 Tax=Pseudooceanicola sp. TaxID=1914328 RepID=UPI00405A1A07
MVGRMVKRIALGVLVGVVARQVSQAMGGGGSKPRRLAAGGTRDKSIRDAGPKEMRDPPRQWDKLDEEIDESFPASDPPANY